MSEKDRSREKQNERKESRRKEKLKESEEIRKSRKNPGYETKEPPTPERDEDN